MSTETRAEATLQRFNAVQVYVHALLAISIFLLWLTGLPITFQEPLGWLLGVFGHSNVIFVHIVAGVGLVATMLYYTAYMILGFATRESTWEHIMFGLDDIRELIAQGKWLAGLGPEPESGKYTFLQKAEIWIIAFEVGAMIVTGVLLWFLGTLQSTSPNLPLLVTRDVHAIVAVTMLMGVSFHLFMTHVKEFPIDGSMFHGRVDVGRAANEWQKWASEAIEGDVDGEETTHSTILTSGMVVTMLLFFIIWTGVILQYVFAPLPTGPSLTDTIAPNALPGGALGFVYLLGLNLAAVVCFASIVAIGYGFYIRVSDSHPI